MHGPLGLISKGVINLGQRGFALGDRSKNYILIEESDKEVLIL